MGTVEVQPSASILIPADYLEDVRSALVAELANDCDSLRDADNPEDRDADVRLLSQDLHLLQQLLDAITDTEVTAERNALFHVLEAMCRLVTDRLVEQMGFGPVDMLTVVALVSRLKWAASESIRIQPALAVA
jgi:hypothetical protein